MKRSLSIGVTLLAALGVVAAACTPGDVGNIRSTGAYPIDIFQEMHYNQSFKAQEPPRLAPPAGSVPWRGFAEAYSVKVGELPFVTHASLPALKSDAQGLVNPVPVNAQVLERAAELFIVNCSMCHGRLANAQPAEDQPLFVGGQFTRYGITQPPSFDNDRVRALSAGEAFWSVTNGIGFMPAFANLLTPEERWHLVHLIELAQDGRETMLRVALQR